MRKKRKRGKDREPLLKKAIDWNRVFEMFSWWCTGTEVAAELGISTDTLKRALKSEHGLSLTEAKQIGRSKGTAQIKQAQFDLVKQLDKTMIIFLSKALLGYSDNPDSESKTPNIVIQTAGGETYDFASFKKEAEEENSEPEEE